MAVGDQMSHRVLVAGVGNIFLGDDGFGTEVARCLAMASLPDWVRVTDYGISGMHLAYDMADGYDTTILVDATPRGGEPGTMYVIEPSNPVPPRPPPTPTPASSRLFDAHGMQPDVVFGLVEMLGASRAGCLWSAASRPASSTGSG